MRTTVRLDDDLLIRAKRHAASEQTTLTDVLDRALRDLLRRNEQPRVRERIALPTFHGKGLQPGVDLDDSAALLDLMEGRR